MLSGQSFGSHHVCVRYKLLARLWAEHPAAPSRRPAVFPESPQWAPAAAYFPVLSSGRFVVSSLSQNFRFGGHLKTQKK